MERRKKVLGEEHLDMLTSMNNLAFTWKKQGRSAEAIKLMGKCIHLRTRILGANHHYTLSSSALFTRWQDTRTQYQFLHIERQEVAEVTSHDFRRKDSDTAKSRLAGRKARVKGQRRLSMGHQLEKLYKDTTLNQAPIKL